MNWSLVALAAAFILLDMQNVLVPLRRVLHCTDLRTLEDFTIIVPIFGHSRYWQNREYLERYPRENVLIAVNVTTSELQEAYRKWSEDGWNVYCTSIQERLAPSAMIQEALSAVGTTYAIRLDGDTFSEEGIGGAVRAIKEADLDLASVKVAPSRRGTLAEKLQGVEYDVAMRGRHLRPYATSGACIIAKTSSYRRILAKHSMWFYGEDIETGIVAKLMGMKVGHIDFIVKTDVPETFRKLFKQRIGWASGYIRQMVVNADKIAPRFPFWFLYAAIVIVGAYYGKPHSFAQALYALPLFILIYTGITYIANWSVRSRWMIVFPYYALVQSLLLPIVGVPRYLQLAFMHRNSGRYKIGFGDVLRRFWGKRAKKGASNEW